MVVLHTAIAIAVIVLLIIKVKVDPVISLIIGPLYLGLATGVAFTATLTAIADHDLLLPVRGWARSPHRRHVDATPAVRARPPDLGCSSRRVTRLPRRA